MTKIAIVALDSPDYLVDLVADGMIRLLGRESVHLTYKLMPPVSCRYTHLMKGFFDKPNAFNIHEADALVLSTRSRNWPWREWVKKTGNKNVIFLDPEDGSPLYQELAAEVKVYFKREYLKDGIYAHGNCPYSSLKGNIKPLPFAAIPEEPSDRLPEKYPLFYLGHYFDHPQRKIAVKVLKEFKFEPIHTIWPKEQYNEALRSSRIGVSVRGWGWDTYRYWEIPYFGAMLLSERLGITIPGDFVEDEEAVFYSDESELRKKLDTLLGDQAKVQRIAARGRKACLERHLSIHRAKRVLEEVA